MHPTVTPYLDFNGRAEEALEFYKKAFGAEERYRLVDPVAEAALDEPRRFDEPRRIPLFPRAEHPALEPPRHPEPRPGSPPDPDGSG